MDQLERNSKILIKYIPENAVPTICNWIIEYDIKLKITRSRKTRLGDYRPPGAGIVNHQITVNHDLNKFSFLITLVHEIAHLTTWNKFKNKVLPHGQEWKSEFKIHMYGFLNSTIFPEDVKNALLKYLVNPAASSCSDHQLLRVLKKYDYRLADKEFIFLEKIPFKSLFKYHENRLFIKGEKIRTRFKCKEISTGNIYLFNPLTEVELFENNIQDRSE